jgi:hypothetical protein
MADPLTELLSSSALESVRHWIDSSVEEQLRHVLPAAVQCAQQSPWLDTKNAADYLQVTENALRLRVRAGLVPAHRDTAGRLRFHRDELDQSMRPEPPRRPKR